MSSTVELSAGKYHASIDLKGGGLRGLWHRSRPLVQTYPEGAPAPLSAGQVLAPWPNRTSDGVFAVDGQVYSLPINEPPRNNAIHGVCNTVEWEVMGREGASDKKEVHEVEQCVRLRTQVGTEQGWPWQLEVSATWTLRADSGLRVEWCARNLGTQRQPFGLGWHPYLSALGAPLDECHLQIQSVRTCVPLDPQKMVPCGVDVPIPEVWDLGSGMPLAGVQMDHCFGVRADGEINEGEVQQGSTVKLLTEHGEGVQMESSGEFGWYQVYVADPVNGEGFPEVGRAVAVEPMTCPADALRSGRGLVWLEPGQSRTFGVGVKAIGL
ncbi:aldose epimerase [Corynebacterium auriscanis]|uniref:aldose epimerase family protein n=1 Tax=Corynebacterium auriscanis TaxID=99807 RepID=UPI0025B57805|nr:aldose epimerase [Corynebacterium auriscanis]WJY72068.1 Aldose 1-epimerase [Corynebacterium auriscanis]